MAAVEVTGLTKVFRTRKEQVRALDGLHLQIEEGTVLALLGPNGSGKTTTVRILATLLDADDGVATVLGHDVAREPDAVRSIIGLSGQVLGGRREPHRQGEPVDVRSALRAVASAVP